MTTVDWIIVVFAILLAANGLRQGFIVGALQLVGFAAGAFLGSRVGPLILSGGAHSPYAPLFALGGAMILGTICAALLEFAGAAIKTAVPLPGLHLVDSGLGAVLGAVLGFGLAWIVGAVLLQTPGIGLRGDIQRSRILRALNDALPPSGFILNALARFDPLPQINGPGTADVPPPTAAIARDPQVHGAAGSVVRVLGEACGLGIEGSGWVAGDGLVVTNAHVVAGEDDTVVQVRGGGDRLAARAVAYDPRNDIAVLRVDGLGARALPIAGGAREGAAAAILGFPQNGPYDVRAARLGQTRQVLSQDAYGNGPLKRDVLTFRGLVRSGNSGGPLVDGRGRVVGTVFASAVGAGPHGGYAVPNAIVRRRVAGAGSATVTTGPCAR
ncbi:MAG: MarP family serine protease [Solirubrobacterales bacterium]|nr:MarP family serine protease [Solirubrobacterales bacterium]